jgi:hypothetical protein
MVVTNQVPCSTAPNRAGFLAFPPDGGLFLKVQEGNFVLQAGNQPLAELARVLGNRLCVRVVNNSWFERTIRFYIALCARGALGGDLPGVFTAIQEQSSVRTRSPEEGKNFSSGDIRFGSKSGQHLPARIQS